MKCFPRNVDRDTERGREIENESDRKKKKRRKKCMSHHAEHKTYSFVFVDMSHSGFMYNAVFDIFPFVILLYDLWHLP